jgi:hypothetical protein
MYKVQHFFLTVLLKEAKTEASNKPREKNKKSALLIIEKANVLNKLRKKAAKQSKMAVTNTVKQYCGSVTCWYRMDSDQHLYLTHPDPDPAIFVSDLRDVNKKLFFLSFSAYYFLKVHLHHFFQR